MNLFTNFKLLRLLYVCNRTKKKLASEAESNTHITIFF
jgi:hypothetical protein